MQFNISCFKVLRFLLNQVLTDDDRGAGAAAAFQKKSPGKL